MTVTLAAYKNYVHTIRAAYFSLGLSSAVDNGSLSLPNYRDLMDLSPDQVVKIGFEAILCRMALFDGRLKDQFLPEPQLRRVSFLNKEVFIPIINREAEEWYGNSPIYNFDFMVESFLGMHEGARTIYDIGGHQGVWAAYYSKAVGSAGKVYTFEPSIVNIECSALSFLVNGISNVINMPIGVGAVNTRQSPTDNGLLVAGVSHFVNMATMSEIFWEPADFIKIDIEGFEYELLKSFPIFQFCSNIHLELHVPHLDRRGLNYRDIYDIIPFDDVTVRNWQGLQLTEVDQSSHLEGYCSLFITPK